MDRIEQTREDALHCIQVHAELSRRQVVAIGQGDELGQRRGRREMQALLDRAQALAAEVEAAQGR